MSAALSTQTRAFLAKGGASFIAGERVSAREDIAVLDPSTGRSIAMIPDANAQEVDEAVRAARAQIDGGAWAQTSPAERQRVLLRLAELMERDADQLAEIEALNSGKLLGVARGIEVAASIEYVRYMAGWATKIEGSTLAPSLPPINGAQWFAYTVREPVGVVGAITPWNFPLMMAAWKVAPALACGNAVVLKPAAETPLTALRLAELAIEAGLPAGVFNVVTGGADAGAALTKHSGVDKLTFTGSTQTGRLIAHAAAERIIPCTLELGGKSPVIVLEDCDPDIAAAGAAQAIFLHQGQVCVAGSRLYVHRTKFKAVTERLAAAAASLKIGSPFDPATQIGPLQSKRQQERVRGFIDESVRLGARALCGEGGGDEQGFFVKPTVLVDIEQSAPAVQQEIFGPVVVALPFDELDEAARLANDTPFGLGASLWSNNLTHVHRLIPQLKAGTVWVNAHALVDPSMPHGGYKQSGVGREHGATLIEHYTQTKTVCMAV